MNYSIKFTKEPQGKRLYRYKEEFFRNANSFKKQYNSLNLVNEFIQDMLYNPDITTETAIDYIYVLYKKYFSISRNSIGREEIKKDVKLLSNTYKIPKTEVLSLLQYEALALQMFVNMQLKLHTDNEKDMKPKDKYEHIIPKYKIQAITQEMFDSFARHFVHFVEPKRIKYNIINPQKARNPHFTHIQYFLLSLYYQRTKYQVAEEKIGNLNFIVSSQYGIFPLMWAELKYCIENNIYINRCSICKEYYTTDRMSVCCYNERCKKILKSRALSESKEQKRIRNQKNYRKRRESTL